MEIVEDFISYSKHAVFLANYLRGLLKVSPLTNNKIPEDFLNKPTKEANEIVDARVNADIEAMMEDDGISDTMQTYKISGNPCNRCGKNVSWDLRPERHLPLHVDAKGRQLGDGECHS